MNKILAAILFECTIVASAALQIPLKKSAQNTKHRGLRTYLNPVVISVYSAFLLITVLTTLLYQYVDLTLSTLLYKTEYIFITLFSVFFLKERVTKRKLIGFIIIVSGVLIYSFC